MKTLTPIGFTPNARAARDPEGRAAPRMPTTVAASRAAPGASAIL